MMSLIRCHGPVRLPKQYRDFLLAKRALVSDCFTRKPLDWYQALIHHERLCDFPDTHCEELWVSGDDQGMRHLLPKPIVDVTLAKQLSSIISGKQDHLAMTLVRCESHADDHDKFKATALLIPYKISRCHYLVVEDEQVLLKPNHIYSFNQFRSHRLRYGKHEEQCPGDQDVPASLLNVCFLKAPKTYIYGA